MNEVEKTDVLAIDDVDIYGSQVPGIIRECSEPSHRPLVLVEVRSNKVEQAIPLSQLHGCKPIEVVAQPLTDSDIDKLIDVLEREHRLGVLKSKPRDFQRSAFREQAGRELLVAMYQATTGKDFRRKMVEELDELAGVSRFIYALLAVATASRFDLTRDEVIIAAGDGSNETLNVINSLLDRKLIATRPTDQGMLRSRHRLIAQVLFDILVQRGQAFDVINGLVIAAATKAVDSGQRNGRPNRIIKRFISHDFLHGILGDRQPPELYEGWETLLNNDYHYWLHRGSFEVEWGDISVAEHFLSQAKALNDHDPYVTNEWAYLLFKRANLAPGSIDAKDLVEEATRLLISLIGDSHRATPHPYHVLGSQGLAWARRGIRDDVERGKYLLWLERKLDNGCKRFYEDNRLPPLRLAIKEQRLSLAISR